MAISAPSKAHSMSATGAWIARYRQARDARSFDELLDESGAPRPSWRVLFETLASLGETELRRRWEHARGMLRDHGVSYDVYGDPDGTTRPWNLSPIPVVLDDKSFAGIAAGIAQRATLLDAILADLYGPQKLLIAGDIPPELVFGHPRFLRPCAGIVPAQGRYLPLYAADLVRNHRGELMVLADRTRAPSGAGYALENRIVLSRSLPEVFRECNVERLAGFFRTMRDTLRWLAPHNRDNPRIVLLTPGPYNATYFEQAFLSQYLGLTLVQGGDLAVREHRVYLKTLGGLQPVDVILRRVNDDFCDPLELRPDSYLGVPGLTEAIRAGNVALANPLGSGLLQTAAFMPFLPALCRRLLGQELRLPSVPSYWCGDPESLAYVEAHIREMVVRPALPSERVDPVFARDLEQPELELLRARIRAEPRRYVAQQATVLSSVPTLAADGFVPAYLWMRTYAVATTDGSYMAMPGALSRVGGPGESLALSLRPGGESKDTWVLAGAPVAPFSLLRSPTAPVTLSRGGGDLPSRIADNLFWLGRYAERAEGTARLARAVGIRLLDPNVGSEEELPAELDALFAFLEAKTQAPHPRPKVAERSESTASAHWFAAAEDSLLSAIFADEPLETVKSAVGAAYRVARTVRDRISQDTWRTLVQLDRELGRDLAAGSNGDTFVSGPLAGATEALDGVIMGLAAFSGLVMDSMTRGQAWRFLDIGRRLERAMHVVTALRHAACAPCRRESQLLEALLEIADSSMTYRRRYLSTLQVTPVVDLLLTDDTNARSVLFQLEALAGHLDALPHDAVVPAAEQQRLALAATSALRLADVKELSQPDEIGNRPELAALLDRLLSLLPRLSNAISGVYLNHAIVSRQLRSEP